MNKQTKRHLEHFATSDGVDGACQEYVGVRASASHDGAHAYAVRQMDRFGCADADGAHHAREDESVSFPREDVRVRDAQ